jgi:hypothetical protein
MPVILVTWEIEIRRTAVQSQLGQIVCENPSQQTAEHSSKLCRWLSLGRS